MAVWDSILLYFFQVLWLVCSAGVKKKQKKKSYGFFSYWFMDRQRQHQNKQIQLGATTARQLLQDWFDVLCNVKDSSWTIHILMSLFLWSSVQRKYTISLSVFVALSCIFVWLSFTWRHFYTEIYFHANMKWVEDRYGVWCLGEGHLAPSYIVSVKISRYTIYSVSGRW